jgi:hypothetical protein
MRPRHAWSSTSSGSANRPSVRRPGDRRIAELDAQLTAAGLTPEAEDDRNRRIRLGQDMHLASARGVSMEDWKRSLGDEG